MEANGSETEWARRAVAGDRAAFTRLVEQYRGAVVAVAAHLLGDPEAAHDVAQEAFIHAYLHLGSLREPERFGAWLRRITVNLCADRRRGGKDNGLVALSEDLPAPVAVSPERLRAHQMVRAALAVLSPKTRLTVLLFHLGGYSHAEIAAFLDIPLNTVRSRLRLARQKLREEIWTMMEEERAASRPDPEWTKRTVEEAMRRGEILMKNPGPEREEAWRHFDTALETLNRSDPLTPAEEEMKQDVLFRAGNAYSAAHDRVAQKTRLQEALTLAERRGDRRAEAKARERLAVAEAASDPHGPLPEAAATLYQEAATIYRELGDVNLEGVTLLWMVKQYLHGGDDKPAEEWLRYVIGRGEAAGKWWLVAEARAELDLLIELRNERFLRIPVKHTATHTIRFEGERALFHADFSGTTTSWDRDIPSDIRARVGILGGLGQFAQNGVLLEGTEPGRQWEGWEKPDSYMLLSAKATILSNTERVETPAGIFTDCLLVEQVTTRTGEVHEKFEKRARELCGTRRAYLVAGVGLVRLEIETEDGTKVTHVLHEYQTAPVFTDGKVSHYFPMTVGNTWTYHLLDTPDGWKTKEFYRVCGLDHRGCWCLERYAYALQIE